jgi:TPR repeat protein
MDELKRLLRRLDGLDGSVARKTSDTDAEQRGYVGALRGAPAPGDEDYVHAAPMAALAAGERKSSNSSVYLAAITAAVISTVTVYLMMTWQEGPDKRGAGPLPSSDQILPSKLDPHQSATGTPGSAPSQPQKADGLLLRAQELLEKGDVEAARVLLRQAAEFGSGTAALKLGRTYDPAQSKALSYADSQTNSALAKAWYERALSLGTQEAASYMSSR